MNGKNEKSQGLFCRSFCNNLHSLSEATEALDGFLDESNLAEPQVYLIRLALEELATNIVKYAYPQDGREYEAQFCLELAQRRILTLIDSGSPFNPLKDTPAPDFESPIEDRQIGGLGIHLLKESGIHLEYNRENGRNILRAVFPETNR